MFTVDVRNIKELYDDLNAGNQGYIARLSCAGKPFKEITTTVKRMGARQYSLETVLDQEKISDGYVTMPSEQLERALPNYEILVSGERQRVVQQEGRQYFLEINWGDANLHIQHPLTSEPEFEQQLREYAQVLQAIFPSFYPENQAPNCLYVLGSQRLIHRPESVDGNVFNFLGKLPNTGIADEQLTKLERKIEIASPHVSFDAIGGSHQGKVEMIRIYEDITHPEIASFFGRDPDERKGYLITGDSGSGKTLLVKALATKLKADLKDKVKFYAVDYRDITSTLRGGEAQATGLVFDLVKRNEAAGVYTLLFLDEIHAIGQRKREYNEALDTLLSELNGMVGYKRLTTIGATYLPIESLDPALIRQGRLSVQINILKPNVEERTEIFDIYLRQRQQRAATCENPHLFAELDLNHLATAAKDFNGSHIAGVVEKVVTAKEDEIKKKLGTGATLEQIRDEFIPITMAEMLQAIKTYPKVERASARIGFHGPDASRE